MKTPLRAVVEFAGTHYWTLMLAVVYATWLGFFIFGDRH